MLLTAVVTVSRLLALTIVVKRNEMFAVNMSYVLLFEVVQGRNALRYLVDKY